MNFLCIYHHLFKALGVKNWISQEIKVCVVQLCDSVAHAPIDDILIGHKNWNYYQPSAADDNQDF